MKTVGRPKGSKNVKETATNISITSVTLDPLKSFGIQLRQFRLAKGYTLKKMEELTGTSYSNICHFENADTVVGNSIYNAVRYCKGLGIKQIKITIK